MSKDIKIRKAEISDAGMLLALAEQIGYPIDLETSKKRLQQITNRKDDIFLVAENDQKQILGFVHGLNIVELLTAKTLRLGGLVVDETAREQGIGRKLMQTLEEWAKKNKFEIIIVPSNVKRLGAAKFYPKIGYKKEKQQNVFIKKFKDV